MTGVQFVIFIALRYFILMRYRRPSRAGKAPRFSSRHTAAVCRLPSGLPPLCSCQVRWRVAQLGIDLLACFTEAIVTQNC
jgi:hypothetical protein